MNTETPVTPVTNGIGTIYFDADCVICQGLAHRYGPAMRRAGYRLEPLQTPGAAERLGVTTAALHARMHFQTSDGRSFAGADAYVEMARNHTVTQPLVWLARIPGARSILRRIYDWVAAHRYCANGRCSVPHAKKNSVPSPSHKKHHTRVFLDLP